MARLLASCRRRADEKGGWWVEVEFLCLDETAFAKDRTAKRRAEEHTVLVLLID
jgi:hypothetical protein